MVQSSPISLNIYTSLLLRLFSKNTCFRKFNEKWSSFLPTFNGQVLSKKIWFFKQLTRKYSYPDKIIFSLNYFILCYCVSNTINRFYCLSAHIKTYQLIISNMGVLFCESLLVSLKYCYTFISFFSPCVLEIGYIILKGRHWLVNEKYSGLGIRKSELLEFYYCV